MRVFLTNVPSFNTSKVSTDWDKGSDGNGLFPPVGLMYLAAALLRHGRHQVKLVDWSPDELGHDQLAALAKEFNADLVGISTFTPQAYDVLRLSRTMRQTLPSAKIIWGGPHTLNFHRECMVHPEVDFVLRGEAEESFPAFCDALEDGLPFDHVPGLLYRQDGQVVETGEPGYIKDIDSVAFPAFEVLEFKRYFSILGTGELVGTICTSRGCPFHCTFCTRPYATSYRSRSVENILAEMELYLAHGVREFFFFDELFNITTKRVKQIAEGILDKGWDIYWSFRGRIDGVDEEMLQIAHQAGCRQIFYGVETGTDEGLKAIKKHITVAQTRNVLEMTRRAGIISSTNWIIGFPHDKTEQDLLHTINTAIELDSDYAQFNILIALPNTEIFDEGVKLGLFDPEVWRNFAKNPIPNFMEPTWEQYFTRDQLSHYLKMAWRRFYFQPRKVVRMVLRIRSLREFALHVRGAMSLLGVGAYQRRNHIEGVESSRL